MLEIRVSWLVQCKSAWQTCLCCWEFFVMCRVTVARCGSLTCAWWAVISPSACVSPVGRIDIRNCPITFDSCASFSKKKNQPRALQMVMTPVSLFGSVLWILAFDTRILQEDWIHSEDLSVWKLLPRLCDLELVENIYLGVAENHLFSDKFSYMNKANKGYEVDEKRNINKSDISHFVTEQKNKEIIVLC